MKVQLVVVRGKPEGKVIPLAGPNFKIGRGETCHLRPNSEQVSREHAEFTLESNAVSFATWVAGMGPGQWQGPHNRGVSAQGSRPGSGGAADFRRFHPGRSQDSDQGRRAANGSGTAACGNCPGESPTFT